MRETYRAMTAGLISVMAAAGAAAAADSVRLKQRVIGTAPGVHATGNVFGTIHSDELTAASHRNVVRLERITIAENRVLFFMATKHEFERAAPYVNPTSSMLR